MCAEGWAAGGVDGARHVGECPATAAPTHLVDAQDGERALLATLRAVVPHRGVVVGGVGVEEVPGLHCRDAAAVGLHSAQGGSNRIVCVSAAVAQCAP